MKVLGIALVTLFAAAGCSNACDALKCDACGDSTVTSACESTKSAANKDVCKAFSDAYPKCK